MATPEFRIIRLHTRRRRDLTGERSREKQRAEAALKLSSVLTDLHGVTGRDIMDRLIAGQRDPRALAGCARTRARAKIPQLREALEGAEFFTAHHARLLASILSRIDAITAETGELSAVTEELLAPYEEQLAQAGSMPGWGRRAAQDVIAETGTGMTRFPAPGHLASWAGRTPLDKQSGARKGQRRHKRGNKYIGAVTGETAVAAGKTDTREGARHRRLVRKRGKAKACVAIGNTQMRVFHVLLCCGVHGQIADGVRGVGAVWGTVGFARTATDRGCGDGRATDRVRGDRVWLPGLGEDLPWRGGPESSLRMITARNIGVARFAILGPLEVHDDGGAAIAVAGARLRGLTARLALAGGHPVSTAALTEAVWDCAPPSGQGIVEARRGGGPI